MSSSGNSSFFSLVVLLAVSTLGSVYAIKHRGELMPLLVSAIGKAEDYSANPGPSANREVSNPASSSSFGDVELKATPSGHFETEAEVNGSRVDVMIDTGATMVALTYEDAERAGIYLNSADFTHQVKTANGTAKVAPVEIASISIGDITVRNVPGAVTERGKLHRTLLGMSFLSRLSRVEMRSNALVLHE